MRCIPTKRRKPPTRLDGENMLIGIKDLAKLFAITIVTCCAVFVCALFLNYTMDVVGIKNEISTPQGLVLYDAQLAVCKVIVGVSGGCLVATTIVLLIFYVKNYIDSHGKELGILKALGYSNLQIAKHFWVFGLTVLCGSILGFLGASCYMPTFYKVQNAEGLFPHMEPQLHIGLCLSLLIVPTVFFALLSVSYALIKLKKPVLMLLKEVQKNHVKISKKETKDFPFLTDLKKNTLKGRKTLVFFVGFSAFCFSSMLQMAMSMDDLASESFFWMMLSIGLILAFMTLLMSLATVIKGNTKTIAMMKVFGYSEKECSASILGGYRPVSYIGFVLGTLYQYMLLKITVDVIFADFENMPEYHFDFKGLAITLILFVATYEIIMHCYARKIGKQSVKGIMLE